MELQVLQMKYATGDYLGRDKTLEKISARCCWRSNMTDDVKILFPYVKDASAQMANLLSLGQLYI